MTDKQDMPKRVYLIDARITVNAATIIGQYISNKPETGNISPYLNQAQVIEMIKGMMIEYQSRCVEDMIGQLNYNEALQDVIKRLKDD